MRFTAVALGVLIAGCGRRGFESTPPSVDAMGSAAPCVDRWIAGQVTVTARLLPNVNTIARDVEPFIAADHTTLYFASSRDDDANDDIYRATTTAAFADVTLVPDLSSPEHEGAVTISENGLVATVSTARTGLGIPGRNLWEATRSSTTDPFSGFTGAPYVNVNTTATEYEHWTSRDRLRLYVSANDVGVQHITVSSRTTTASPFSVPMMIPELGSPNSECCMSLSGDERVIVFASSRDGNFRLYYATRMAMADPFSAPLVVPMTNPPVSVFDLHTSLSDDACTLYFSSVRSGNFDLWAGDF
ncbi:MAG: PD40 domain-containing protein [Deltaproteobacteria bacterium]|nr:PD40 domain-containing protein [Deltaproteobacteria bacterium]